MFLAQFWNIQLSQVGYPDFSIRMEEYKIFGYPTWDI